MDIALSEEEVFQVISVEVGDAMPVSIDLHFRLQTCDPGVAIGLGGTPPGKHVASTEDEQEDNQKYDDDCSQCLQ